MAGKAYLITHPETQLDREGRIHGRLDPPLSHSGSIKARQIARRLKSAKIARIHSSPRVRAKELAKMLSEETGAPVMIDPDLVPWDLASLSGAKTNSIRPVLEFFSSRPSRKIPGGEAKGDVLTRYKRFTKKLKPGDAVVGHSQHSLAWDYARKGGDAAKVPMIGGKAGEIRAISL